jgi:hypothetical protein
MYFLTIFFIGRAVALFSPAAEQQRASHPRRCRHRFSGQEKEGQVWKGQKDSLGIGTSHPGFARLFPVHGLAGALPFLAWIGWQPGRSLHGLAGALPFLAWIGWQPGRSVHGLAGALPFLAWIGWQPGRSVHGLAGAPCRSVHGLAGSWPFHAWIGWQPGRSMHGLAGSLAVP